MPGMQVWVNFGQKKPGHVVAPGKRRSLLKYLAGIHEDGLIIA